MNPQLLYWFNHFRQHQKNIQTSGGGVLTTYPSGRTELSFASAPFGEHALSAFYSAKRHINFINRSHRN